MNQSVTFPVNVTEVKTNSLTLWKKRLGALLLLQALLVVGMFAWHQGSQPQAEAQPLLTTNLDEIDKLVISDTNTTVTLQKVNGAWQLPDLQQLPVDTQKLTDLFDKLKGTRLTWPVATTASSHERFDVSDKKFQRRIELYKSDKETDELLLGTSPGFRKVHLRRDGADEVYAVQLNSFEFAVAANDWLKKDLLAVANPQAIIAAGYSLQKKGDNWEFTGTSEKTDNTKVVELGNAFNSLQVTEVAGNLPDGEKHHFTVRGSNGEYQYEFVKADNNYFVKRNDKPQVFKLSQHEYERIVKPTRADLITKADAVGNNQDPLNNIASQALQGVLETKPD
jgi:hypothetical protein